MIIHQGYNDLKLKNPVVTLGYFDGVHRGHKYLLECLINRANETDGNSVVVTFDPHPRKVLSGDKGDLAFLTSMDEKKILLEKAGIDVLIIIPFTYEFSKKEACEFIKEVLVDKIGMKQLFVGFNHHFGRGRGGDYNTILECAAKFGFKVERIAGITLDEGNISSTTIRAALQNGELEKANQLLGYDYFMNGFIVEGKRLGRSFGYPTANVNPDYEDKLIPAFGVYAVEAILNGRTYKGMLNIGVRPTVNSGSEPSTIEVHLFDFKQDIYNSKITLVFRYRMRDEIKFDSIEALIKQMDLDKVEALRLLNSPFEG